MGFIILHREGQPQLALLIAVEMQEMELKWQREACEWINMNVE